LNNNIYFNYIILSFKMVNINEILHSIINAQYNYSHSKVNYLTFIVKNNQNEKLILFNDIFDNLTSYIENKNLYKYYLLIY